MAPLTMGLCCEWRRCTMLQTSCRKRFLVSPCQPRKSGHVRNFNFTDWNHRPAAQILKHREARRSSAMCRAQAHSPTTPLLAGLCSTHDACMMRWQPGMATNLVLFSHDLSKYPSRHWSCNRSRSPTPIHLPLQVLLSSCQVWS